MTIANWQGCTAYDAAEGNAYSYRPSFGAGIAFSILFFLSTSGHIVQMWMTRMWWTSLFAIGALVELLGWAARTWSAQCPNNLSAFLMQICTLILGPAFYTAAIYVILGRLINLTGGKGVTSIISSRMYLIIFCGCDLISMIVQAVGGSAASSAASADPPRQSTTGTNIMVAGIVFQMASITVFAVFFVDFLRRCRRLNRDIFTRKVQLLLAATTASTVLIYIRSIYRTVEMLQGWDGHLMTHEAYFVGLDGVLMFLAVAVFNFAHPGWLLPTKSVESETKKSGSGPEGSPDSKV